MKGRNTKMKASIRRNALFLGIALSNSTSLAFAHITNPIPSQLVPPSLHLASYKHAAHNEDTSSRYSFEEMKSMETRLENLQREAPELLCGFYEKHLKSFSVRPGAVTVSSAISFGFCLYQ
jgi:hypothetical protein